MRQKCSGDTNKEVAKGKVVLVLGRLVRRSAAAFGSAVADRNADCLLLCHPLCTRLLADGDYATRTQPAAAAALDFLFISRRAAATVEIASSLRCCFVVV